MKCPRCHEESGELKRHHTGADLCPDCFEMDCPTTCMECGGIFDAENDYRDPNIVYKAHDMWLCEGCAIKQMIVERGIDEVLDILYPPEMAGVNKN